MKCVLAGAEDLFDSIRDFVTVLRRVLRLAQARVNKVGGVDLGHDQALAFEGEPTLNAADDPSMAATMPEPSTGTP